MNLASLAVRNVARHKLRTSLTILGIVFAIWLFVILRTVVASWTAAIDYAAKDRIATRHKVTFIMTLPRKYVDDIRNMPGIEKATWANWFGGKDPKHEREFFATIAVDPPSFLEVYDEIVVDKAHADAWKQNRRGALVGDILAKKFGWKVGDRLVLTGTIFPGDWEFDIEGIYTASRKSVDRATLWFHWAYLNESLPPARQDQVGWIITRVNDPTQSAQLSKKVDDMFDSRDTQTITMSEKALSQSFLGMFSAILKAIDIVSVAILAIIALILGNTIAMAVRERTREYGALKALGFRADQVAGFVVGEAVTIGLIAGVVGVGLAQLFINGLLGPVIEEQMSGFFPYFRVSPELAITAILLAVTMAASAAAIPARRAARLKAVDALRAVE